MGQIAICAETGSSVEAFSLTDLEWDNICHKPSVVLLMPVTGWPAIPKTSIRGLRFFAHAGGYPGKLPSPESYAHTRLKIDVVKAAREAGLNADIEVFGRTPDGDDWIADALVTGVDGRKTAFEIQLSSQHLKDYRTRTDRYKRSGVNCCWITSFKPAFTRLGKSIAHENIDYYQSNGERQFDLEELLTMCVMIEDKAVYPETPPELRFGRGKHHRRLSIMEAVCGVVNGMPRWHHPYWTWDVLS